MKWQIEYSIARGYSAATFADASGASAQANTLSVTQTAGAQYTHHITDDDAMILVNSAEIEPDSVVLGRVFRDAGEDTFGNDAYLIQVEVVSARQSGIGPSHPEVSSGSTLHH